MASKIEEGNGKSEGERTKNGGLETVGKNKLSKSERQNENEDGQIYMIDIDH